MNEIIVYHGGTDVIELPICKLGRRNLDFGQGFYVTDLREQALSWASNMAKSRKKQAVINRYRLNKDAILKEARCRVFKAYDKEWLEFIVGNRMGQDLAKTYDYVEGGVANDRVIDTVNLYIAGLIDGYSALRELAKHQPNNQMCLLNQDLLNKYLIYDGAEVL